MAFRMKHTGGPYGDACSSYDVMLDHEYTVQEFVEEVLKEKQDEWGNFTITTDFHYTYTNQKDSCQYKYGKITDDFKNAETKSQIISEVKAHGGWTAMDYFIKIADTKEKFLSGHNGTKCIYYTEEKCKYYNDCEAPCHHCNHYTEK